MNKYKLIILFGKAGSGKNYLLNKIYKMYPDDLNLIISDTTRPPRFEEKDGIDYNFLTKTQFHRKEHIEQSYFNNWYYGTPVSSLKTDKINIGIMNPDGIRQIFNREDLEIYLFYISAPETQRIIRQIKREKYPNVSEICRRFLADEEDFKNLYKYPYKKLRNSKEGEEEQCTFILAETINQLKSDLVKMR